MTKFKQGCLFVVFLLTAFLNQPARSQGLTMQQVVAYLSAELQAKAGPNYYESFHHEIIEEDENWIGALLIGHPLNGDGMTDPHEFLIKKIDGQIVDFAFIYSEKYDAWLDDPTMSFFDEYGKIVRYSNQKFHNRKNSAKGKGLISTIDEPVFAFPWHENDLNHPGLWKFNSGPHSYGGPNHPDYTWSGIDFGENANDIKVRSVADGGIVYRVNPGCEVYVRYAGGWEARYLHTVNQQVKGADPKIGYEGDLVNRGDWLADVDMAEPICAYALGSHLHFDFRRNDTYIEADQMHIGGWKIFSEGEHYEGYLERNGVIVPTEGSIFNFGYSGHGSFSDLKRKLLNGITLCTNRECTTIGLGTIISPAKINALRYVLGSFDLAIHFFLPTNQVTSLQAQTNFACVDFDVSDLSEYYFPGTALNLLQNAIEARVVQGNCNPADRATKSTGEGNGFSSSDVVIPLYCNETDNTWFTLYGDDICYSPSSTLFFPHTLPFSPIRVKVGTEFTKQLFLVDQLGNCHSFTAGMDIAIPPDTIYVRSVLIGPAPLPSCAGAIITINDVPFVYAIMENLKNIDPPLIVWKTSDVNPQAALSVVIELRRSGTLLKQFELQPGVNQWQPDVYDPGNYTVSITTKGGSYQPGPSSTQGFTLVEGPNWYQGWDEQDSYFAGDTKRTQRFTVAPGGVVDIWGSNILINGIPITTTLARGMTPVDTSAAKTIYRLGAGEYNIEWLNGLAYQGADNGFGHHVWLAEKNTSVYGGTWTTLDLRNPNELPTPTPTSSPTPSMTPTANPSVTNTPTPSATATPVGNPTPNMTSTSTPTQIGAPTTTSTPIMTPSATSIPNGSATPTPQVTVTVTITATASPTSTADSPGNQSLRLFLPLVTR